MNLALTAGAESRPGGNDRASQTFLVCLPGCRPDQSVPGFGDGPVGPGDDTPGGESGGAPPAPAPLPDLRVASLSAADDGADCRVTFAVRNDGGSTQVLSEVSLSGTRGGSTYSATAPIGGLQAGESVPQTAVLAGTSCSGLMIEARADHLNQVAESDEGNNLISQAF